MFAIPVLTQMIASRVLGTAYFHNMFPVSAGQQKTTPKKNAPDGAQSLETKSRLFGRSSFLLNYPPQPI